MREALSAVWSNPYVKVLVALLGLVLLFLIFRAVHPAGTLFLGALGLAYVVTPIVDWLERYRVHRGIGVVLMAIIMVSAAFGGFRLSLNAIHATLTQTEDGIALTETAQEWIIKLPENVERLVPEGQRSVFARPVATVEQAVERLGSLVAPYAEDVASATFKLVSGTVMGVFQAVVLLILTIYVLYDFHRIMAAILALFPRPYHEAIRDLARTLDDALGSFIRGQIVIAALVGIMVFIGLALIGLPLAGFIGLLAGALNLVPFLGSIVPTIPAIIIALAGGWWQVALVLLVFVVANQVDNHILTPYVLSRSTKLHPVAVIVAVLAGFAFGGLVAAILAVPFVAFVTALLTRHYKESRFYRDG